MGWTWQEYQETPQHFIDLVFAKINLDRKYQVAEAKMNKKQ